MIPVFTFHCLDFIIASEDGYVKTHSSGSTARGRVLKNLQGWADVELMKSNKPILPLETFFSHIFKIEKKNLLKSKDVNDDVELKGKEEYTWVNALATMSYYATNTHRQNNC